MIGREDNVTSDLSHSETLVLNLLQANPDSTFSFEELVRCLPELHWSAVFSAVDQLSRCGAIEMRRKGFDYVLRSAGSTSEYTVGV